jgi:hypothetical protein
MRIIERLLNIELYLHCDVASRNFLVRVDTKIWISQFLSCKTYDLPTTQRNLAFTQSRHHAPRPQTLKCDGKERIERAC